MQTEKELNNSDHYLLCNNRFSDTAIKTIKADVKRFMADRDKDDDYFKFINWQKKDNELLVLTMYAYKYIDLPKKFDRIFQVDKPGNFIDLDFIITQAVINGLTPFSQISKGHKHICIVEFDKEVPHIFNSVPAFNDKSILQTSIQLGFCDKADFKNIKTNAYIK